MPHISLAPEVLTYIGSFPVTNTLLVALGITLLLSLFAVILRQRLTPGPGGALQNAVEFLFEHILSFLDTITEDRHHSRAFLPLVVTIFFFVLVSNLVEIVPGLGTVGLIEHHEGETLIVPFLRSSSADLNVTVAVALASVIGVQVLGVAFLGFFAYSKKFFYPPWRQPYVVGTFIGALEGVAELAKIVSFSFRLFGNIFAGEVLLTVVLFLMPYGAPLPFLVLEVFVGLVQAVVFSMLTLVFLKVATAESGH
ncbi:MAG: FoF1 ATP synthase subunit a [bacterium]|nr:FoF1 ATP synthase subunit a [bacterium]